MGKNMIIEPDTHRKCIRIPFDREVNLEFISDRYDSCRIKNLSLTGMFATGSFTKQEGNFCLINLLQEGMPTESCLQATAKVVRKNDEGLALEFTSMPFESYIYLQTILLSGSKEYLAVRHQRPDQDCPFEITDQLPISKEASCLKFLQ